MPVCARKLTIVPMMEFYSLSLRSPPWRAVAILSPLLSCWRPAAGPPLAESTWRGGSPLVKGRCKRDFLPCHSPKAGIQRLLSRGGERLSEGVPLSLRVLRSNRSNLYKFSRPLRERTKVRGSLRHAGSQVYLYAEGGLAQ